jgi:hypothetical protein
MTKIAIIFAGQLRCFDYIVDNLLQNVINYYNADVFCHTWTSNEKDGTPNLDKNEIETKLQKLNPKKIQIDEFILEKYVTDENLLKKYKDPKDNWYGSRSPRTIAHYYSVYAANELKKQYEIENNFKYDFVIRSRYDMELKDVLYPLSELLKLDINSFYMHTHSSSNNVNPGVYFGGSEVMDKVSSMYTFFNTYFNQGIIIFDECVFNHHLKYQNINIKRINLPYYLRRCTKPFIHPG